MCRREQVTVEQEEPSRVESLSTKDRGGYEDKEKRDRKICSTTG